MGFGPGNIDCDDVLKDVGTALAILHETEPASALRVGIGDQLAETGARQEVVAEHRLPEPFDRLQLREEAMPAEVEAVAVELDRLCDPAHDAVRLEDGRVGPTPSKDVGSREARRPRAKDGDSC